MTTYNTIQEAFKNGQGDVFFAKNNQYVAFSRHCNVYDEMKAKGFDLLTYSEVIKLSFSDNTVTSAAIWANAIKGREKESNMVKSYSNTFNGRDGYYDEFPDAYGQSL